MHTYYLKKGGLNYKVEGDKNQGWTVYEDKGNRFLYMGVSKLDTPRKALNDVLRNLYSAYH